MTKKEEIIEEEPTNWPERKEQIERLALRKGECERIVASLKERFENLQARWRELGTEMAIAEKTWRQEDRRLNLEVDQLTRTIKVPQEFSSLIRKLNKLKSSIAIPAALQVEKDDKDWKGDKIKKSNEWALMIAGKIVDDTMRQLEGLRTTAADEDELRASLEEIETRVEREVALQLAKPLVAA